MKRRGVTFLLILALFLFPTQGIAAEVTLYPATETQAGLSFEAGPVIPYQPTDEDRPLPALELAPMYRWMEMGAEEESTLMISMPLGRVLAYVCRTDMGQDISAKQLRDMWPQIAQGLEKTAMYVDNNPDCAFVEERDGHRWLRIQTMLVLDGEKMLAFDLGGYINCDDGWMKEIWVATPARATYLYDEKANAELTVDIASAKAWLDSIKLIPPVTGEDSP